MSRPHVLLRFFRQLHLYIGVFVSPALLFFAFTGALQTFSLHETTPGSSYQPPKWAMVLAQIHKKATPVLNAKKQAPSTAAADHIGKHAAAAAAHDHGDHDGVASAGAGAHSSADGPSSSRARGHHPLPLKLFFLLVAIGLFTSTLTGLYMSWKFAHRRHGLLLGLFFAGIILPIAFLFV